MSELAIEIITHWSPYWSVKETLAKASIKQGEERVDHGYIPDTKAARPTNRNGSLENNILSPTTWV